MRLLIKLPSRSRPDKLLSITSRYVEYAEDMSNIQFIISLDADDEDATPELIEKLTNIHSNIQVILGHSKNKIDAVNRDIPNPSTFDILLLASDDMNPVEKGYDQIIRKNMRKYYPDTDGVLFFNDGFHGRKLNTLVICGSKYYSRFNYIYYPEYKSMFCDNEFMDVANNLKKQTYFETVIIKHEHPFVDSTIEFDELYKKNQVYFEKDKELYTSRKNMLLKQPRLLKLISF